MTKLDDTRGLHQIGDELRGLTHLGDYCSQIATDMSGWICRTCEQAQIRDGRGEDPYRLCRNSVGNISKNSKLEEKLERSLWKEYRGESSFLPPFCKRLVSYQIPLFDSAERKQWGKIDLIGESWLGLPVVVELKQDGGDNPLRMLVEGAAYCVAIEKAWRHGPFREAWAKNVCKDVPEKYVPKKLEFVPLLCLAPDAYWKSVVGDRRKRKRGQLFPEHWGAFHRLVGTFMTHGIIPSFATFDYKNPERRLPSVVNVRPLVLPA